LSQHAESPLLGDREPSPAKASWWIRDYAALKEILFGNWINVLLVVVPLGIGSGYLQWPATWVFVLVRAPTRCNLHESRLACAEMHVHMYVQSMRMQHGCTRGAW
jgi:hypothetical protein